MHRLNHGEYVVLSLRIYLAESHAHPKPKLRDDVPGGIILI